MFDSLKSALSPHHASSDPAHSAQAANIGKVDVMLIGGGVMSSTLGVLLHELEPQWSMLMLERLDAVANESTNGWNNAGTGHCALAELNYTPEQPDGTVQIGSAVAINEAFQVSRRFWTSMVERGVLSEPRRFINAAPHMSFVFGDEDVRFLRQRHEALRASPLFEDMRYSEDEAQLHQWVPLMMEGRNPAQKVAATWSQMGTDVNFGEVTRQYVNHLQRRSDFDLQLSCEARHLKRNADGTWRVSWHNMRDGTDHAVDAKFVFVGAGGAALPLLQASGIPEARDYGAFPVGGAFLVTEDEDIARRHLAKVYGRASVGAPPMSVPHLDTRVLDGKRVVLFGPFATFSTKFLKHGSYLDLLHSIGLDNIAPMLHVGFDQFPLVEYLAEQLSLSEEDRLNALREYFPRAQGENWRLFQAGQRVQVIKRDGVKGGVLKMGTEIVSAGDGSIAGLLGASPGASTAAPIMLDLLHRVFRTQCETSRWRDKLRELVPHYGSKLGDNVRALRAEWASTGEALQLAPASLPA
ncbi:malate dehydrogenase (quinone) [Paraburkholderia acidipaludis]|uniref:malate dehydrogenase (quinone) n=1 Tax=Paraburkholderia acidipaludis TaxID=660537 RepID=UPI000A040D78|nr:malate dehydrogenase (quinone) [Paraburkholderia acidipaludis]